MWHTVHCTMLKSSVKQFKCLDLRCVCVNSPVNKKVGEEIEENRQLWRSEIVREIQVTARDYVTTGRDTFFNTFIQHPCNNTTFMV